MLSESQRRRAQNEAVFRQRNEVIKSAAKQVLPKEAHDEFELRFICECANENCHETIELTAAEYEATRRGNRYFIVLPGHDQGDIEGVASEHHYLVVKKFEDPPPSDGRLKSTS
jgi:hypothetical protein